MPLEQTEQPVWALIAGASEGLGAAFATAYARRGMRLVLVARRAEPLQALADKLTADHGIEVVAWPADLARQEDLEALLARLSDLPVGAVVLNAAAAPNGTLHTLPLAQALLAVDVNVRAPLVLLNRLLPAMVARGAGEVVIMSSMAGYQGVPRLSVYAATKAFLTILGEGLWHELRPHGVDVVVCTAGAVRTPGYLAASGGKDAPGTMDPEEVVRTALHALGRRARVVPGWINWLGHWLVGRLMPRQLAVGVMARATKEVS